MEKKRKKSAVQKPPGSFCANAGRWRWIVTLPGETKRRSLKLAAPGQSKSLPASQPLEMAWRLAWRILEQHNAALEAGGIISDTFTVRMLREAYLHHCRTEKYFDPATSEIRREYTNCAIALRHTSAFDNRSADAFTVDQLRTIRDRLRDGDARQPAAERKTYVRTTINKYLGHIQRMYRWAQDEGLVPAFIASPITEFTLLKKGQTRAAESIPVEPADDDGVLAVMEYMDPQLRDMVAVQWICNMRPGEVIAMRPQDLDREDADVWIYDSVLANKNRRRGQERFIAIFPEAQTILKPYLEQTAAEAFLFTPQRGIAEKHVRDRAARASKVQPSQVDRAIDAPRKTPGRRYATSAYGHAVTYAIGRANTARVAEGLAPVIAWSPNQLRHSAATQNRALVGREIAAKILGHSAGSAATDVYSWKAAKAEAKKAAKAELRAAAKAVMKATSARG